MILNIVVIILIIFVVTVLWFVLPICFMHPLPSGEVEGTNVTAIKNRINNLFFVPTGEEWIAIDAGSDADVVKQEMERFSIDAQKVKNVFLTHTDYDHVAALTLFPNATVYMNKKEKQMLDGSTYRQLLKKNKLPISVDENRIVWMSDNDIIDCSGHQVQMIASPGHTRGSAMYAVDERYLFSGDAFRAVNGKMVIHPYTMDNTQADRSIERIKLDLDIFEKVFTAHYGLF